MRVQGATPPTMPNSICSQPPRNRYFPLDRTFRFVLKQLSAFLFCWSAYLFLTTGLLCSEVWDRGERWQMIYMIWEAVQCDRGGLKEVCLYIFVLLHYCICVFLYLCIWRCAAWGSVQCDRCGRKEVERHCLGCHVRRFNCCFLCFLQTRKI